MFSHCFPILPKVGKQIGYFFRDSHGNTLDTPPGMSIIQPKKSLYLRGMPRFPSIFAPSCASPGIVFL
jgi:hypothetical protein